MDLGIAGRTAVITGGAGGIGFAAAEAFGREGVRVVLIDIDGQAAEAQAAKLAAAGTDAMGLGVDIIDRSVVEDAVSAVGERFGSIDILVNNAGFTRDMRITRMQEDDWDSVVDVILKGTFFCTRAVLPGMIERQWGRIVNISSRAHLGNPGQANYSAAKAGIIGFTKAMALENGKFGVTVNAVAPGLIDTAAVRGLRHYESIKANAEKSLPIPRLGQPEDVAAAIVFLSSEPAQYITGDVLHVTGGRYG